MKKLSVTLSIPNKPIFRGFEIENPFSLPGYKRNLPHLRIEGATYFVTFRLSDSIPRKIIQSWLEERDQWLIMHGVSKMLAESDPEHWHRLYYDIPSDVRYAFERTQRHRYFVELDKCHGTCILKKYCSIVAKALDFFHQKRAWIGDYVVMPNHVHVLVQPFPGILLEDWLYSVKRFSSTQILKELSNYDSENSENIKETVMQQRSIWLGESFDRIVRDTTELRRTRRYIALNPAKLRKGEYELKIMNWLDELLESS